MRRTPCRARLGLPLAVALAFASPAVNAQSSGAAAVPVVVELFTSQGCYSCPPAEAYLGRLARRDDVIALEFHVDYWDDLVYGSAGKWKDPFSSPHHTRRQRAYNLAIRRTGGVYTPQMVIGGTLETVGSHESKVEKAIASSRQLPPSVAVQISNADAGHLAIQVSGGARQSAGVWIVHFHRGIETTVRSGENKGKTLTSHHIVTGLQKIGDWTGGSSLSLQTAAPQTGSGQGCAVLVQQSQGSPVLGAAYCPAADPA